MIPEVQLLYSGKLENRAKAYFRVTFVPLHDIWHVATKDHLNPEYILNHFAVIPAPFYRSVLPKVCGTRFKFAGLHLFC